MIRQIIQYGDYPVSKIEFP